MIRLWLADGFVDVYVAKPYQIGDRKYRLKTSPVVSQ